MRVLVTGGRVGIEQAQVFQILEMLCAYLSPEGLDDLVIIDGQSPGGGVDQYAREWTKWAGVAIDPCPIVSSLDGYKSDAPKRRNKRMLETKHPDCVVAFPGGPGTRNMMDIAYEAGVQIYDVEIVGNQYQVHFISPNPVHSQIVLRGILDV